MNRPINTSSRSLASGRLAKRLPALALGALVLSLALVPAAQAANPQTNGAVSVVTPDGSGGWYIGGTFTTVNGSAATNAAHVKADGTLDTNWLPNPNGAVSAITLSGSDVFLGGQFSNVGGTAHAYVAKVGTNGTVSSWDPKMNSGGSTVLSIVISGSTAYLGGGFRTFRNAGDTANVVRNNLAAVDTGTGALSSWNPNVNGSVRSMILDGSTLYLGGGFTTIGAGPPSARNLLAAVSTSDGSVQSWDPSNAAYGNSVAVGSFGGNLTVNQIAKVGSSIYAVGSFNYSSGARIGGANFDATSGAVGSWNPQPNNRLNALAVGGSVVYVGGPAGTFNGTARGYGAAFKTSDSSITSWDPKANGSINAISAAQGSQIAIGGTFTTVNGSSQTYFGALALGTPQTPAIDSVPATPVDKGTTIKSSGYSDSPMPLFQWQRCLVLNDAGSCTVTIAGQSGAWYGTRDADIGYQVRVRTYWQTVSGVVEAFSALSGVVVPVGTVAPALSSQSPKVGTNIASSFGTWQGWITNTSTVAYEWQQCTASNGGCTAIGGAPNAANYKPVAGSVGKYLRVKATITTRGQSASQFSAITTNAIAS
ncbi:MAG: hypothetical protein WCO96_02045 [Actinomycetes bacterium]